MIKRLLKIAAGLVLSLLFIVVFTATTLAAEDITPAGNEESTVLYSGACGTDLTWALTSSGTLTIDGSGALGSAPWSPYSDQIIKIVVSDGVTSIAEGTFGGCSSLKEITLPFVGSSRNSRENAALFGYIFGSQSYTGGAETKQQYWRSSGSGYSDYTYYYIPVSLKKVTITNDVALAYGAFYNCVNIVELDLNDGITSIGGYAFCNCGKLDTFKLPSSLRFLPY